MNTPKSFKPYQPQWWQYVQQLFAAATLIFDDVPTKFEERMQKKRKREFTPYKRNVVAKVPPPVTTLEPVHVLDSLLVDDNREYVKKLTHLQTWQFFSLLILLDPSLKGLGITCCLKR
jgi:hypothetical protein